MNTDSTDPVCAALRAAAQHNADLADAYFAQSATLCIYLLDMREFYRWAHELPLGGTLRRERLGPWVAGQEAHWERLRAEAGDAAVYRSLAPEASDDPFDVSAAAPLLAACNLVYGAGIGRFGRPLFFLAEPLSRQTREGVAVTVCGRELARGSSAPPAMSRAGEVLVRRDALLRWLWTRFEEWIHHPRDNGFLHAWQAVAGGAEPAAHPDPVAVVERLADIEVESLILHELGERNADALLGEEWREMIDELDDRKLELFARSLRDLLADCRSTLPRLAATGASASVHLWFGLAEGLRAKLAPTLLETYRRTRAGDTAAFLGQLEESARHWEAACRRLLESWHRGGEAAVRAHFNAGDFVR